MRKLVGALCLLSLVSCGGGRTNLPTGSAAYALVPAADPAVRNGDYRIGPLDELAITVFQEPDLSLKEVKVDAAGNIVLPLIGQVHAADRTSRELGADIARRLGDRLLVNPQVSLNVTKAASQTVTVEGQVKKPGIYDIPGSLTLVQAVALAEGPTDYAKPSEVIVFRTKGQQRYAAQFDLGAIRAGRAQDPTLQGRDVVIIGYSNANRILGLAVATLPGAAGLFVALNTVN